MWVALVVFSEFEKYETNYFGELPLIISNALDVDIGFFGFV